ncbi:molecular chaperone MKKS isoform X1 [Anabrus simplex]|uniref:molecular chaperone MKKS isoform X1 n=1 Tax=Anabrus simplex TaxID=316456 RepID=UPI0035A29FF5
MMSGSLSVVLEPLDSSEFLSVLRSFLDILSSCRGPKAGVKLLVSSGGITTVTSSSSRLLCNLMLDNPLCVMVTQVMKSQISTYGDYGLYCGVLTCSLMEKVLSQDKVHHNLACELIQHLGSTVTSLLILNCMKLCLNFDSVKELLSVVKPILSSKPACGLSKDEIAALSVNVTKAFLKTVDEDLGEVLVLEGGACEGSSKVLQGVLYPLVNEESILEVLEQKYMDKNCAIPLLLFNVMLTESGTPASRRDEDIVSVDDNNGCDFIGNVLWILEQAVKLQVGIVACQKVVHSSIRMYLQRNNILLLERMGTELTRGVEKLSGAKPLSSLQKLSLQYLQSYVGHIESVSVMKQNKKQFILLENEHNVATVLLFAPSEEACSELKVVTDQALKALRQLIYSPCVTPGAGCAEACLAVLLQAQIFDAQNPSVFQPEQLRFAVGWLQRTLLITAGFKQTSTTSLSIDSIYYHLWQQKIHCCCGLVAASQVEDDRGQWIELNSSLGRGMLLPSSANLRDEPKTPVVFHDNAVLEVYSSKYNALKLALESCSHMLSIGIIVYKPCV